MASANAGYAAYGKNMKNMCGNGPRTHQVVGSEKWTTMSNLLEVTHTLAREMSDRGGITYAELYSRE